MKLAIVGAGIHGLGLANALVSSGKYALNDISIFDDRDFLELWVSRTKACRMSYLRSNVVHHLSCDIHSLVSSGVRTENGVRPSLEGFNKHAFETCSYLRPSHIREKITTIIKENNTFVLNNAYEAHKVLLCLGGNDLKAPVSFGQHIFADDFKDLDVRYPAVVVGQGISAAHLLLDLVKSHIEVYWVQSHKPRLFPFDAAPRWSSMKEVQKFQREPLNIRQQILSENRFDGSIPPNLFFTLQELVNLRRIRLTFDLEETLRQRSVPKEQVILATGFEPKVTSALIHTLHSVYQLPVDNIGRPDLSPTLEWMPGLFLSGQYAELMLGPLARNIAGMKVACKLLSNSL